MPAPLSLREDFTADALRQLAKRSRDAKQSRRLLALAAVYGGMDRGSAAKVGGMDRQTLRDWVIQCQIGHADSTHLGYAGLIWGGYSYRPLLAMKAVASVHRL